MNWYTYCYNNPIFYKDPTGNIALSDGQYNSWVQAQLLGYTHSYYTGKFLYSGTERGRIMRSAQNNASALRTDSNKRGFLDTKALQMENNMIFADAKAKSLGFAEGSDEYGLILLMYSDALNAIDERAQQRYNQTLAMYAICMVGQQMVNNSNQSGRWGNAKFQTDAKYADHYQRHNFNNMSKEEYLGGARNLLNSKNGGNIQGFTSKDGWLFKYNSSTNEFAIGHPEGTISTYFKPDTGMEYWITQIHLYK